MAQEQQDGQQQQSGWRPTIRQLLWVGGVAALALVFLIIVFCGYLFGWKWTGLVTEANYPKRTFWDWLDLLIVPIVLAVGGYLFTRTENQRTLRSSKEQREVDREIAEEQAETDRALADERRQDDMLQAYLDGMSQLLTDEDRPLHRAQLGDSLSTVARARTLTVLSRLNRLRKRSVVQFLYESGLIGAERRVLDLRAADLRGADLKEADLRKADLREADLRKGDLKEADLREANLNQTDLREADLRGADLREANLSEADLRHANLIKADLVRANLIKADLSYARLSNAFLTAAMLSLANLSWARLGGAFLRQSSGSGWAAWLPNANLQHADLSRANLSKVDLSGANLRGAILNGVDLSGANLNDADLSDADLSGAILGTLSDTRLRYDYLIKLGLREDDPSAVLRTNLSEVGCTHSTGPLPKSTSPRIGCRVTSRSRRRD